MTRKADAAFRRRFWRLHNGTLSWARFDAMLTRWRRWQGWPERW